VRVGSGNKIMAVEIVNGATSTANILPDLKIGEMSWKIVSKKRKKKSSKKKESK